jgi:hypothetical protein
MGLVTVKITTLDDAVPTPQPIDLVNVLVYDDADTFITEGQTGSVTPGEVEFMLNGDGVGVVYHVRLAKDGVSFLPQPLFDILVVDPPAPSNEFTFTGHVGMIGMMAGLNVMTDDAIPQPVAGMRLRVFDDADTFLAEGNTDAGGRLGLTLDGLPDPGKEYIIRLRKDGTTIEGGVAQKVSVFDPLPIGATNEFDFTAHVMTLPESTDPQLCKISGYLVDASLRPLRGVTMRFFPREGFPDIRPSGIHFLGQPTVVRRLVIAEEIVVTTDSRGYIELELPRTGVYDLSFEGLQIHGLWTLSEILVPDVSAMALEELLFPYVTEVAFDPATMMLTVGTSAEAVLSVTMSNLQLMEFPDFGSFLEFDTDNHAVATVVWNGSTGKLSVIPVAPGTASVTVLRRKGTVTPRLPIVPVLTGAISITVT